MLDRSRGDLSTIAITGLVGEGCDPEYYQSAHGIRRLKIGDADQDGIPDLTVKFDREDLQANLCVGEVEVTIGGAVDGGCEFEGTATVRVIHPGKKPTPNKKPRIPPHWPR